MGTRVLGVQQVGLWFVILAFLGQTHWIYQIDIKLIINIGMRLFDGKIKFEFLKTVLA